MHGWRTHQRTRPPDCWRRCLFRWPVDGLRAPFVNRGESRRARRLAPAACGTVAVTRRPRAERTGRSTPRRQTPVRQVRSDLAPSTEAKG
jgi:hypothetical protein